MITGISIIIPVHDRAHTLQKCVESILSQSYKHFELILVDDHSTDNSVELANKLAEQDNRIIVIEQSQEKKGAQAARNTGIKNAKYDWIMFNDSDDIWTENKIERELFFLEENNFNKKIVLYSDCNTININTKEKKYWALPEISKDNSYKDLLVQSAPMFQSLCCSSSLLFEAGFLDESVPSYQEWDTSLRLAKNGGKFVHIKEALFDYYIGANDAISKSIEKDFIGRSNIYNKWKQDILKLHGNKIYKIMLAQNFNAALDNNIDFENLKKNNQIIFEYEKNLIDFFGNDYRKNINKLKQKNDFKRSLIWRIVRKLYHVIVRK